MVTEVFVLCDAANDSSGKLNILGAFDTLVSTEFPLIHPHCAIALRLRYASTDATQAAIRIIIQSVEGTPVIATVDTTLKPAVSTAPTSTANLIVNVHSLRVDKPGDYSVILQVNGIPTAITPLYVRHSVAGPVHRS